MGNNELPDRLAYIFVAPYEVDYRNYQGLGAVGFLSSPDGIMQSIPLFIDARNGIVFQGAGDRGLSIGHSEEAQHCNFYEILKAQVRFPFLPTCSHVLTKYSLGIFVLECAAFVSAAFSA